MGFGRVLADLYREICEWSLGNFWNLILVIPEQTISSSWKGSSVFGAQGAGTAQKRANLEGSARRAQNLGEPWVRSGTAA